MKRSPLRRVSPRQRRRERELRKLKAELIASRGPCCQRCGRTAVDPMRELHAHHLRQRSLQGPDTPANLSLLCGDCHMHVHAFIAEATKEGWLVPSYPRSHVEVKP